MGTQKEVCIVNYINENAWAGFIEFSEKADLLNCEFIEVPCGAKLIDAGVRTRGGLSAGLHMVELSTANLSSAAIVLVELDGELWPHVEIHTDQPFWGCFISQSGNRTISVDETKTIYSGPACILADRERFKEEYNVVDDSDCAVLIMEGSVLPNDGVCKVLAERCGVQPSRLGIVIARTASLTGTVQIAGRSVETTLQKLHYLGLDPMQISSALGRCPVTPPGGNDHQAIGKVNDVMVCGSQVWFVAAGSGSGRFLSMLPEVLASTGPLFDKPFEEILTEAGRFFQIDKGYFGPAEISIIDLESGQTGRAGKRNISRLAKLLKS
jgi:methenyltetrahydromethanopterin cyclohydrolase